MPEYILEGFSAEDLADDGFMDAIKAANETMMKDRDNTYGTIQSLTEDWTDEQLFNLMSVVGTINRSGDITGNLDACLQLTLHSDK